MNNFRTEPETYTAQNKLRKSMTFGKWHVALDGDLEYDNGRYYISADRLTENNWIAHLFEKAWIDWNDFIPAYFQALKNIGVQKTEILIHY
jgi:hypothetical protein